MSTPRSRSNRVLSPSTMRPPFGVSRPATERRIVVLPLPEWPSSAITSPSRIDSDTPLRISLSPYRFDRRSISRSGMEAYSQAQGDREAGADQDDIHDRQR